MILRKNELHFKAIKEQLLKCCPTNKHPAYTLGYKSAVKTTIECLEGYVLVFQISDNAYDINTINFKNSVYDIIKIDIDSLKSNEKSPYSKGSFDGVNRVLEVLEICSLESINTIAS